MHVWNFKAHLKFSEVSLDFQELVALPEKFLSSLKFPKLLKFLKKIEISRHF